MGLLGAMSHRTCPHGHGALELLTGWFALQGVYKTGERAGADPRSAPIRTFAPNGQVLPLRVWRCPECGHVELVDEV